MHADDARHGLGVGKADEVEEAPAQERVRQLLLVVAGDDHDRAHACLDELTRLVDPELHAVEFEQQVVWKLDVGLVDLVDQQHSLLLRRKRLPELATDDVVADVVDLRVAELRVAQTRDRVVLIQPVLRLRRRLDVPAKSGLSSAPAISSASCVLPVPGSPLTSSGRASVTAALTAIIRSSVAT